MSSETLSSPSSSLPRRAPTVARTARRTPRAALARILERPAVYRLWQWPFAAAKLAPVRRHNDLGGVRCVLDVGCGPGTNAASFPHARYVGVDINPAYVAYARRRYGREFVAADVRTFVPPLGDCFDFVLVNSLFHHLDDDVTRGLLTRLATYLTDDGHVHILDLVSARRGRAARLLARLDRGTFARSRETWLALFTEIFEPVVCESYAVPGAGVTLWNMLYFKGRVRGDRAPGV